MDMYYMLLAELTGNPIRVIFLGSKTSCFHLNFYFEWHFKQSNTPRFV
jgi:hypothetical protein